MAKLSESTFSSLKKLQEKMNPIIKAETSFEEAAQKNTTCVYDEFKEAIVLNRLFLTLPYSVLPDQIKTFVDRLASVKKIGHLVEDQTLVLTLLGTSGVEAGWNDRSKSQGHIGIPLVSAEFIEAIPMMSRLLKQLGLGLDWIDSKDTEVVKKTIGSMSGMFFVPDAKTEIDQKGRKIIADQNFVTNYQIQTVFGYGGGYLGSNSIFVNIIFLRETLDKRVVDQFASVMSFFKNITRDLLKDKLFR
jgi:hypothetical protein